MSIARAGDAGALIELGAVSFDELQAALLAAKRYPGVTAAIAGHSSVLVLHDEPIDLGQLAVRVESRLPPDSDPKVSPTTHELQVRVTERDSPELPRLLSSAGMNRNEFLAELSSLRLRARYLGFRPGFAYLEGLPVRWNLPRLSTPRVKVPEGSLGIAGTMAGFYSEVSPGGWNLVGRTDAVLWNPWAVRPNLIAPGDVVSIKPIEELLVAHESQRPVENADSGSDLAEVVASGQLTLLVRGGDRGRCVSGLPEGGPFDRQAAAVANGAVGNRAGAPILECVAVGPTIRFLTDCVVSWAGAAIDMKVNGRPVEGSQQVSVSSEDELTTGPLRDGLRGYLAIHPEPGDDGGPFQARPTVLTSGRRLRGQTGPSQPLRIRTLARSSRLLIRSLAGPHPLEETLLRLIESRSWTVSTLLDRVGIRLLPNEGEVPDLPADLPSCGTQFGTVQWHPDGNLVVLGPDHPITGGYLQPMTVMRNELWKLALLKPGESVRWAIER